VVRKAYTLYRIGGVVSEILYSPAAYGLDLSVLNQPKPKARISALVRAAMMLAVKWLSGNVRAVSPRPKARISALVRAVGPAPTSRSHLLLSSRVLRRCRADALRLPLNA
jgi:hypothetical protein